MRFGLLGPVALLDGNAVVPVRAAMPRTLLAALLLEANRVVSAGYLSDTLWCGHPPATAAASLHNHVSRLRAVLGKDGSERIRTATPGYLIEVFDGELDADVFTELSARGRGALRAGDWVLAARDLGAALTLWRGDPLADVEPAAALAAAAGRLAEQRLDVLEGRIDADLHLGRAANVIAELGTLISAHPLRERFRGQLMLACYQAGRQGDALAAYQHARAALRSELGVEPGAELQRLHQRILAADPSLDASPVAVDAALIQSRPGTSAQCAHPSGPAQPYPVPAQLPAATPDFTGRSEQLALLGETLAARPEPGQPGAVVVAAITGAAGIGKTTLAVHVAHRVRDRFPDGQLYASLRGISGPAKPADVLARFLRDLGLDPARVPAEEEERAALLRTLLSGRSVLIVLDDARDTAQVRPLLPGSVGCAVLVTSRNRLGDLTGTHVDLEVLDDTASLVLFTSILGASRAAAEPEAAARLVRLSAGLPLAIRIAAARLAARPSWSIAMLAGRLADQRQRLGELQIGDLALRASFQLSYAALGGGRPDVDTARAFRLLGLFEGPDICLPGAAALFGLDQDHAQVALETLVDAHLLQSVYAGRYQFHDLLRVYAVDLADGEQTRADCRAAVHRLISWYLHTADAAARVLAPSIQRVALPAAEPDVRPLEFSSYGQAMEWCETERANLVVAVSQAARYDLHDHAWRLPVLLRRFFRLGKYWADWIATYQIALASAVIDGDRKGQGLILNSLGEPYTDLGQFGTAFGYREQALAIQREIGDRQGEARTLGNLGVASGMLGRLEESLTHSLQALAIFRDVGDRYYQAVTLENIGNAMLELRRYDQAMSYLRQALAAFRDTDDTFNQASTLNSIGKLEHHLRHYDAAARCYRQALRCSRAARDRGGEAAALRGLGDALLELDDPGAARRSWLQARDIFCAIGDPRRKDLDTRLLELNATS